MNPLRISADVPTSLRDLRRGPAMMQSQMQAGVTNLINQPGGLQILDAVPVPIFVAGMPDTILYRNSAAARAHLIGDSLRAVFCDVDYEKIVAWPAVISRILRTREPIIVPCTLESPLQYATITVAPYSVKADAPTDFVVVTFERSAVPIDPTLPPKEPARLSSLGRRIARVAHDLNNPLDGILRYIQLSLRSAEQLTDPTLKRYLTETQTGLRRMASIVGELLDYPRQYAPDRPQSINAVVEQAINLSSSAAQKVGVIIAADLRTADLACQSATKLYQICCNLIKNAIQTMRQGGRLVISSDVIDDALLIQVADSDIEVPGRPDAAPRPLYTGRSSGAGLGLAMCRELAEELHGSVTTDTSPAGATRLTVRIPLDALGITRGKM